ncbi:efflux RND transporter periplasmic adaptor subunit [Pedobacter sp. BS3]|uniref:efflux RND transporter periplasmic adaptor subunit n=1 Tax=Pedobacter sp. BS3 TaxID=2567937 RepID=UPI001F5B87F1|nr:efflux RND transporter periplasmic adaptor subunit [Pedobacter sp. BS3]
MPAIIVSLFSACSTGDNNTIQEKTDQKFTVTDSLLKQLLIDTVAREAAVSELTLTGKVTPDEDKMVKIYPMVSGLVQDVKVQSGDFVNRGQVLATLQSAEVAGFSTELISAEAALKTAQRNQQVTADWSKSGLASDRDVELAADEYRKAEAEYQRAKATMQLNPSKGMSYVIKSPVSGFVIEKNITNNMQVRSDNAENLFTVANLSDMWVMANVYESDIAKVKTGDDVWISTLSYPDKVFKGKIDKVYNVIDPQSKVMGARIRVNNPQLLLKPGMFATVTITTRERQTLPVINARCLVFDDDKSYVVAVDTANHVRVQPVVIDRKAGDKVFISKGLHPGDRIIASRQVFLYESLKN